MLPRRSCLALNPRLAPSWVRPDPFVWTTAAAIPAPRTKTRGMSTKQLTMRLCMRPPDRGQLGAQMGGLPGGPRRGWCVAGRLGFRPPPRKRAGKSLATFFNRPQDPSATHGPGEDFVRSHVAGHARPAHVMPSLRASHVAARQTDMHTHDPFRRRDVLNPVAASRKVPGRRVPRAAGPRRLLENPLTGTCACDRRSDGSLSTTEPCLESVAARAAHQPPRSVGRLRRGQRGSASAPFVSLPPVP
jgi:hypothetical protein